MTENPACGSEMTALVTAVLLTSGNRIVEIAPGIVASFGEKQSHSSLTCFTVAIDREKWKCPGLVSVGVEVLVMSFECLGSKGGSRDRSLVGWLEACITSRSDDVQFHSHPRNIFQIEQVVACPV